jgi:acid phosphatase type 7
MLFPLTAATFVALATTTLADKRDDCTEDMEPTQIRLAYYGDRGMAVSWNTKVKMTKPTVDYGTGPQLDHSASSDISTTYPTSSTYNNHVVITGLDPDTRYHYQPQCGNRAYSFITARSPGKGDEFKFAMVGDMGTMGPDGLSTTVGTGAANPLKPGEKTSIDSLHSLKTTFDFVWHGL